MRSSGYLCKSGERKNQPLQQYVEQGLFELKKGSYVDSNGSNITTTTTKVTGKDRYILLISFWERRYEHGNSNK
ncbi:phage antirepressor KilAC domain-containing protein [Finegoldia magna]|uniref:phage antirepressor KilAC domain-containing protein n=1 Tax=Finegoldia magna TaxID=1260 RepID=UPI0026EDAB54|nr:phage antirepressor KilAC domain-containing protein [Finegoldia magna]